MTDKKIRDIGTSLAVLVCVLSLFVGAWLLKQLTTPRVNIDALRTTVKFLPHVPDNFDKATIYINKLLKNDSAN